MMTHLEKHGFITYKKYSYLASLLKNNIPKDSNRSIQKKKKRTLVMVYYF